MIDKLPLNKLEEEIKIQYKLKDIIKITKDINDGRKVLIYGNEYDKDKYIKKIENDYKIYIKFINFAINTRILIYGSNTVLPFKDRNEIITKYINMLEAIRTESLYEEILKIINMKTNKFNSES